MDLESQVDWPPAGRYVVAVSGGADSMALVELLRRAAGPRGYELIAAHVDHRMRPESADDRRFVADYARDQGLDLAVFDVGPNIPKNEADARSVRYGFLRRTALKEVADAIITAHHRADVIETSLLNLARGSGWRGIVPFRAVAAGWPVSVSGKRPGWADYADPAAGYYSRSATADEVRLAKTPLLRPLFGVTRSALRAYLAANDVAWREDATNADVSNPRNLIRHELMTHAPAGWTGRYLENLDVLRSTGAELEDEAARYLEVGDGAVAIRRDAIRDLGATALRELILAACLRLAPGSQVSARMLDEAALFVRTAKSGRRRTLTAKTTIIAGRDDIRVIRLADAQNPVG